MVVQRLVAGRHDLIPVARAAEIAALRGVRQVVPRLWGYYFDPLSGANFTVMAADDGSLPPGATRIGRGVARVAAHRGGPLDHPARLRQSAPPPGCAGGAGRGLRAGVLGSAGGHPRRLPHALQLPGGPGHGPGGAGREPPGAHHDRRQDRGALPRCPAHPEERDPPHLRLHLRLAERAAGGRARRGRCWPSSSSPGTRPRASPPRRSGRSGSSSPWAGRRRTCSC